MSNQNYFDNVEFKLKYPTVDLLVEKINEIGPSALLYKIDLERAFRNLRIDPFDYPVLGLKWKNSIFVDLGLPSGFATGAVSCQSCTDLVTWTLSQKKNMDYELFGRFFGGVPPPPPPPPPHKTSSDFLSLKKPIVIFRSTN